jgi:hypothetical protein
MIESDAVPSIEANEALYRRWFEDVVSGGDLDVADELLSAQATVSLCSRGRNVLYLGSRVPADERCACGVDSYRDGLAWPRGVGIER